MQTYSTTKKYPLVHLSHTSSYDKKIVNIIKNFMRCNKPHWFHFPECEGTDASKWFLPWGPVHNDQVETPQSSSQKYQICQPFNTFGESYNIDGFRISIRGVNIINFQQDKIYRYFVMQTAYNINIGVFFMLNMGFQVK